VKKPKLRVPIAPLSKRHKTKKDYDRQDNKVKKYVCHKCKKLFIADVIKENKIPTCIECWDWKGENP